MLNPLKWHRSLKISIAAVILIVGVLIGMQLVQTLGNQAKIRAQHTPTASELEILMYRLGFDPESLTAAGVESEQIEPLVGGVVDAIIADGRSVDALDNLRSNINREFQQLGRKVRTGKASVKEIKLYQERLSDKIRTNNLQEVYLDTLRTGGQVVLKPGQIEKLALLRENAQWNVPIEFRVVKRTEEDWIKLRDALTRERAALRNGEVLDAGSALLLAEARHQPETEQVQRFIDEQLDTHEAAFQAAIERVGR